MKTIAERIREGLPELTVYRDPKGIEQLRIGDMDQPYDEVFGGSVSEPNPGSSLKSVGRYHGPRFTPQRKNTSRVLLPPPPVRHPRKTFSRGVWEAVKALTDWYRENGQTETVEKFARKSISGKTLTAYVAPFLKYLSDREQPFTEWMLEALADQFYQGDFFDGAEWHLPLAGFDWNEEGIEFIEAQLTGPEHLAGVLEHCYPAEDPETFETFSSDPALNALLKKVGWTPLVVAYADEPKGEGAVLRKLEKFGETYFGDISERYEDLMQRYDPPVISEGGASVPMEDLRHINFVIQYNTAFNTMVNEIPFWYEMDQGRLETHVQAMCKAYRKAERRDRREAKKREGTGKTLMTILSEIDGESLRPLEEAA